ncbi:MAG: hypothetical protein ACFFD7_00715 [Candidatus Thorarchaeota archaeon]
MKEKLDVVSKVEEQSELNIPKFYEELNKAIRNNNLESIYKLSKIITRHQFKKFKK